MDGRFVPNLTFGAPVIAKIRPVTELLLDAHLMIEQPEKLLKDFIKAGANSITFHVEATDQVNEIIEELHQNNVKVGLSVKPGTDIDSILPYLENLDLVLVMTVEPGFSGQNFMGDMMAKIEQLVKIRAKKSDIYHYLIQVDGGVNSETVQEVKEAGVDVIVASSFIFKATDYAIPIQTLHDA